MGTSTAFLAVLRAERLSRFLRRNLRCGGEAYIARGPTHLGGLWRAMAGCTAIGSLNATADPLVNFYSTARTNGQEVTLRG